MMTIIPDIKSGKAYDMNVLLTIFKTELSKLITIVNSLVFSKLLYCSSVWTNTTKKNIDSAKFCSPDSFWNAEI